MLFKGAVFLVLLLFMRYAQAEELGQLTAQQVQAMQQHQQPLIVDIRTEAEWKATGLIPNSKELQSYNSDGAFDSGKWLKDLQKLKTNPDQDVILVCRSGNRSKKVGKFLLEQGMTHVYHLSNGIESWIKSGYPVSNQGKNSE